MEHLKLIADICSYLTIIVGLILSVKKITSPLKSINDRICKLEQYSQSDYMSTLRLTIMSEEMPLEERLAAGEKYVNEGGNGAVKAKYQLLIEEYKEKNGGR